MKLSYLVLSLGLLAATTVSASNESGNGGFAYQSSFALLQASSRDLVRALPTVPSEALQMIQDTTNFRERLIELVTYDNLVVLPNEERFRGGLPLAMDYDQNRVLVLKPFFVTYAGTRQSDMQEAARGIQRELLHEAAHLFGLNEHLSRLFSDQVMRAIGVFPVPAPVLVDEAIRQEALTAFYPFLGYLYDSNRNGCFFRLTRSGTGFVLTAIDWRRELPRWEEYSWQFADTPTCPIPPGTERAFEPVTTREASMTGGQFGYLHIFPGRVFMRVDGLEVSVASLRRWFHQ